MLKISALNEEPEEEEENEEEVTREALEEIALQQYAKGLELQRKGRPKEALNLLSELLDTELLDGVTKSEVKEKRTSPLLNLKYLCYKNIGSISFEIGDLQSSVQAYLDASNLDDSDVTLWFRLGKVSLAAKKFDLACYSFRKGVECNQKHWPCLDNLITVLYGMGENDECISYIYNALALDPEYLRGRLYRKHIFTDLPHLHNYLAAINQIYKWDGQNEDDLQGEHCDKLLKEAAAINKTYTEEIKNNKECTKLPILSLQKEIKEFTWASLGESLTHMHNYITTEGLSHACTVNINTPSLQKDDITIEEQMITNGIDKIEEAEEKMDIDLETSEVTENKDEVNDNAEVEMKELEVSAPIPVLESEKETKDSELQLPEVDAQNQNSETDIEMVESKNSDVEVKTPKELDEEMPDKQISDMNESNKEAAVLKESNEVNIESNDIESNKETGDSKETDSNETNKDVVESKDTSKENVDTKEPNKETSELKESNKDTKKIVTRRRGSSLSFLEQWEWCNKRRSSRKKGPNRNDRNDENINDTLKRMLPQFLDQENKNNDVDTLDLYKTYNNKILNKVVISDDPERQSKDYFGTEAENNDVQAFIKKYVGSYCDIITMLDEFLEILSIKWDVLWPKNLGQIYLKANICAKQHYDPPIGYDDNERLKTFIMINLLHLEILVNNSIDNVNSKNTVDIELLDLMRMLCSRRQAFCEDGLMITMRYLWVRCHSFLISQNSEFALDCLYYLINEFDSIEESFTLHVPNLSKKSIVNFEKCFQLINYLEQNKRLSTVINLYESGNYENVLSILIDSFEHCHAQAAKQEWSEMALDWAAHLVIIIESLWALEKIDECFTWSLTALHEALKQYFLCSMTSPDYEKWSLTILKILVSIEYIVKIDNTSCLDILPEDGLNTFIRDLARIIIHQYDDKFEDKIPIETVSPWIIFHFILQRLEDCGRLKKKPEEENVDQQEIPMSILALFIGHDCLGKKGWCFINDGKLLYFMLDNIIPRLRSPSLSSVIEIVSQHLEQCVYCAFGHPLKKNKVKYLMDHNVTSIKLDWKYSQVLFELYRPFELPEFNSYRLGSITGETEQLFQKMLTIMPQDCKVHSYYSDVIAYIEGKSDELPKVNVGLPFKMKEIYYLLADYYFKNNELIKALKYYSYDIVICNNRFDSWAGMALARSSLLETKLNSCETFKSDDYLSRSSMVETCYKKAIQIDSSQSMLWVEYGAFVYGVHSFCSRMLKQASESLSMDSFEALENRKDNMLKTASKCFIAAHKKWMTECELEDKGAQDERWLHYYMLGKISEKNGDPPEKYLNNYIAASKFLQENNACYPNKISYNNPQFLSVEALEIHYRIHACILKYMEQHENKPISMVDGKAFKDCLNYCASGPFSLKKKPAKENDTEIQNENSAPGKRSATESSESNTEAKKMKRVESTDSEKDTDVSAKPVIPSAKVIPVPEKPANVPEIISATKESDARRTSQESSTTTNTATSKDTSSDSSSDSSSDDSSSSSSSDLSNDSVVAGPEQLAKMEMTPDEIANVVLTCVHNLEDCVSRFPQHYKALYRLAHFYFYYKKERNIEKCRDFLLGSFTNKIGNKLPGLFSERKNSNFFSGIWRIPTSEIDRPGSFASHMSRCVLITMEVLKEIDDHKTLLDLCLQLQRTPDPEKKYLRDAERLELSSQAMSLCTRSLKAQFTKFSNQPNLMQDAEEKKAFSLFTIDVYRAYQRVQKHAGGKNQSFSSILIDCYKLWNGFDSSRVDSSNILELSIKHCQLLITALRNQVKESAAAALQAQRKALKAVQESMPVIKTSAPIVTTNTVTVTTAVPSATSSGLIITAVSTKNTTIVSSTPPVKTTPVNKITTPVTTASSSAENNKNSLKNFMPYLSNPNLFSTFANVDPTTAALSYAASMTSNAQYQNDLIRQIIETSYMSYNQQQMKMKPQTTPAPKMKDLLKALQVSSSSYLPKQPAPKPYKSASSVNMTSSSQSAAALLAASSISSSLFGSSLDSTKTSRNISTSYPQMKPSKPVHPAFTSSSSFLSTTKSFTSPSMLTPKGNSSIYTKPNVSKSVQANYSQLKTSQANFMQNIIKSTLGSQMTYPNLPKNYQPPASVKPASYLSNKLPQSSYVTHAKQAPPTTSQKYPAKPALESSSPRSIATAAFHSGKIPSSLTITKTNNSNKKSEPLKPAAPLVLPKQDDIIVLDDD